MLVLSRKKNESIVVSENIIITIVEIRGDKVRLGIEAPRSVAIHRSEVHEAIHQSNSACTTPASGGESTPPEGVDSSSAVDSPSSND